MFSDKEIKYIKAQRLARISTMSREGALQLDVVPVGFDFDSSKKHFYVRGLNPSKTKKYRNVLKNEKVALLIDDLKSMNPWSPRGIRIHGTADVVAWKGQGYLKDSNHACTKYMRIIPKEKWSWGIDEPMKKTLIVKYIPRNEQSNTKKLLDVFRQEISNSNVEELDLLEDIPDMFLRSNLLAYINRNLLGRKMLPREENLLSKMDRMAAQLKSADIAVVVFPMYNYSMPAIVKAWFDSVIQKGVTFGEKRGDGQMIVSNAEKKALILISSGGVYSNKQFSGREHALSLSIQEFQYMGYSDVRGVLAEGMSMKEEVKQTNLDKSMRQIRAIAREWYEKERYEDSKRVSPISKNRRFDKL